MLKDKAVILDLPGKQRGLAAKLNQIASDGYELTGITPLFGSVNAV